MAYSNSIWSLLLPVLMIAVAIRFSPKFKEQKKIIITFFSLMIFLRLTLFNFIISSNVVGKVFEGSGDLHQAYREKIQTVAAINRITSDTIVVVGGSSTKVIFEKEIENKSLVFIGTSFFNPMDVSRYIRLLQTKKPKKVVVVLSDYSFFTNKGESLEPFALPFNQNLISKWVFLYQGRFKEFSSLLVSELFPETYYSPVFKAILHDYFREMLPYFPGLYPKVNDIKTYPKFSYENYEINTKSLASTTDSLRGLDVSYIMEPYFNNCAKGLPEGYEKQVRNFVENLEVKVIDFMKNRSYQEDDFEKCFYLKNENLKDEFKLALGFTNDNSL